MSYRAGGLRLHSFRLGGRDSDNANLHHEGRRVKAVPGSSAPTQELSRLVALRPADGTAPPRCAIVGAGARLSVRLDSRQPPSTEVPMTADRAQATKLARVGYLGPALA